MAYHYHIVGTLDALNAIKLVMPTRHSDRTLDLRNRAHTSGQRYGFWKLSKVEYNHKVDAVIRIVEALHPGLVHAVTDAKEKHLAEPFNEPLHSNYTTDYDKDNDPVNAWYDRVSAADSLKKIQADLHAAEKHIALLQSKPATRSDYYGLITAFREVLDIIDLSVTCEEEMPVNDVVEARKALDEIKYLVDTNEATQREQRPFHSWILDCQKLVYDAIRARLHNIAFYSSVPVRAEVVQESH